MIKFGKVKMYRNGENEGFGFIATEYGDVFFHRSFGGIFYCNGSDCPIFYRSPGIEVEVGDTLVYESEAGPKGLRAVYWGSKESYDIALLEIDERPTIRLVKRVGLINNSRLYREGSAKYSVLWQGKDISELRQRFPLTTHKLRDDLDFGIYIKCMDGEAWVDCNDPR